MIAEAVPMRRQSVKGVTAPRIAPPEPIRTLVSEYEASAKDLGLKLVPWQKVAGRYITALRDRPTGRPRKDAGPDLWKYREVCVVVARQNGKTTLLLPRILMGLRRGEQILHTAQNREIPRKTFLDIVGLIARHPDLPYSIRKGNGQEEVRTPEGGRYKLIAPNANVRGETADLVLIDEVRQQRDQELMDAMLPTITAKRNGQIIYLSNAGDDDSVVLNDLRKRGTEGQAGLAYLEWSAPPDCDIDDLDGWAQANPALGHTGLVLENLEYFRSSYPESSFETEHLCRWVTSMLPRIVSEPAWEACRRPADEPVRPVMAINMDASGTHASAVLAWAHPEGVSMRVIADVTGEPVDLERLGPDLAEVAKRMRVTEVLFDPWTDADLARYFRRTRAINGMTYANASERFARLVDSGRLRWHDAAVVGEQLAWTGRKDQGRGAWMAVRARPEHPVTAVVAAIRACWVASEPQQAPRRMVY
jgi:hypothetical protein